MAEQPDVTMHRPSRSTLEVGVVVSIVGMLVGLAFNAGIQYAHINSLENRTGSLELEYNALHDRQADDRSDTQVQYAQISTLLKQVKEQQDEIKSAIRSKP